MVAWAVPLRFLIIVLITWHTTQQQYSIFIAPKNLSCPEHLLASLHLFYVIGDAPKELPPTRCLMLSQECEPLLLLLKKEFRCNVGFNGSRVSSVTLEFSSALNRKTSFITDYKLTRFLSDCVCSTSLCFTVSNVGEIVLSKQKSRASKGNRPDWCPCCCHCEVT